MVCVQVYCRVSVLTFTLYMKRATIWQASKPYLGSLLGKRSTRKDIATNQMICVQPTSKKISRKEKHMGGQPSRCFVHPRIQTHQDYNFLAVQHKLTNKCTAHCQAKSPNTFIKDVSERDTTRKASWTLLHEYVADSHQAPLLAFLLAFEVVEPSLPTRSNVV